MPDHLRLFGAMCRCSFSRQSVVPSQTGCSIKYMPVISSFFGIVIRMFYREHEISQFPAEYLAWS